MADDEDIVRRVGQRVLNNLGYEVVTAADGVEAVDPFIRCQDDLRLEAMPLRQKCCTFMALVSIGLGWDVRNQPRCSGERSF